MSLLLSFFQLAECAAYLAIESCRLHGMICVLYTGFLPSVSMDISGDSKYSEVTMNEWIKFARFTSIRIAARLCRSTNEKPRRIIAAAAKKKKNSII